MGERKKWRPAIEMGFLLLECSYPVIVMRELAVSFSLGADILRFIGQESGISFDRLG